MENNNCVRGCGFVTNSETIMESHMLVHQARILKFEPLKTHIIMAISECRTPEDGVNWERALAIVEEFINAPFEPEGLNGNGQTEA